MTGIYSIKNTINNKIYVGQSVNLESRFTDHKSALRNNRHFNKHLQDSWNKYGEESFEFNIIEECEDQNLDEREQFYIAKYDSMNPLFGYNRNSGGSTNKQLSEELKKHLSSVLMGHYVSPETIEKLRISHIGKHLSEVAKHKVSIASKGRTPSEETKRRISKANKGRTASEETKRKLSEAHKGHKWTEEQRLKVVGKYRGENNPNFGRKASEETRKKQSEAKKGKSPWNKGKSCPNRYKPVKDLTNNIMYESVKEAKEKTGISHIHECASGKRKTAGGIKWKYL